MDALLSLFRYFPPSPAPRLLKMNDVPSTEDRESIRGYLGRLENFIKKYKHKRNPVARYNVQLAERLAEVHRRLLQQTSARDLPPEIIQHIALCVVEDTGKPPWTFTWVCSAWRRAAVGYMQLWCTFPTVNQGDAAGGSAQSKVVRTLIRRSGSHPLKVDIRFDMDDAPTSAIFNLLLQQADRWATAQVHLRSRHLNIFTKATAKMHQLRHLTISVRASYGQGSSDPPPTLDLTKLTALESLKRMTLWPPTPMLPEGTIKSYTGRMHNDDIFNNLLLLSPTLTTLTYTCNGYLLRRPQGDSAKISFPKLKELVFSEPIPFSSSSFPFMLTPQLETVKVSRCSSRTFIGFVDMIARSGTGATLTTLHIYPEARIDYALLVSLFAITPNLAELKIADDFDTAPIIHILSYLEVAPAGHLLPRLKRLTILMPWEATSRIFRSIHSTGLLRMEEPSEKPLRTDFLHRLETYEVALLSNGSTPTFAHEKQERNRNIMESHWQDHSHLSILGTLSMPRKRLYDIQEMVEVGKENMDEVARDATVLLGQLMKLHIALIQDVYYSGVYYVLHDLLASFTLRDLYQKGTGPKIFCAPVKFVGGLLESWRPRLLELAARNRWFNKGDDVLVFLRKDDPRRGEWGEHLINGFPRTWVGALEDQFFPFKSVFELM